MRSKILAVLLILGLAIPVMAWGAGQPNLREPVFGRGVEETLASINASESVDLIVTFNSHEGRSSLLEANGLTILKNAESFPISLASGTASEWNSLSREQGVRAIEENATYGYSMDTARSATRVDDVHAGEIRFNQLRAKENKGKGPQKGGPRLAVKGEGVGVAVVDSGVDITHPDLAQRIVPGRNLRNITLTTGFVHVPGDSDGHNGHGTHVAGIAVGDGTASEGRVLGVAPEARLYAYGHGAGNSIFNFTLAYDHMLLNRQAAGEPPIMVSNNSFGGGGSPGVAESVVMRRVVQAGITVVFSAGNSGDDGPEADTVNRLCKIRQSDAPEAPLLPGIICVANYSDGQLGSAEGGIASSSSRGLEAGPKTWADISAPGDQIQSARAKTALVTSAPAFATRYGKTELPNYITISGTSMAAPHVTGVVALLNQAAAAKGVSLTPGEIEEIIKATAHQFENYAPYPNRHAGHGLIDARAAVERVLDKEVTAMSEDRRVFTNVLTGIVFSGQNLGAARAMPNAGAAASTANDVSDLEGFGRPAPSTNYLTPGASSVSLRAFADDAGLSDLAKAQPVKVCADVTYLGSGLEAWTGCLAVSTDLTQFNSPIFDYSYPADGDVSATFTFDVNGDGVISPYIDKVFTVLYQLSP